MSKITTKTNNDDGEPRKTGAEHLLHEMYNGTYDDLVEDTTVTPSLSDTVLRAKMDLQARPDDPEALAQLARALEMQEREDEALEFRLRYTQVCPDCAVGWAMLAACYEYTSQENDAVRAYERALEIDERYLYARCELAKIYRGREEYDTAIKLVDAEIDFIKDVRPQELADEYGQLWFIKAECYNDQDLEYQAYLTYREGIEYLPWVANLCAGYAKGIASEGGNLDDAVLQYRKALSMQGNDINWNVRYASVLIEQAQEHAHTHPEDINYQNNRYNEALQILNHAEKLLLAQVEEDGHSMWTPSVYEIKAELYIATKNFANALICARQAKAVATLRLNEVEAQEQKFTGYDLQAEFAPPALGDVLEAEPDPAALLAYIEYLYAGDAPQNHAEEPEKSEKVQLWEDMICRFDDVIAYIEHKIADPDGPDPDDEDGNDHPWEQGPYDGGDQFSLA